MNGSNLLLRKNIIRGGLGKYLEGEVTMPPIMVRGHFHIELVSRSGVIKRVLDFKNLIVNAGLDGWYWNPMTGCAAFAAVGTGSTAPTAGDTTLQAEITPQSSNRTNTNGGVVDVFSYITGPPDAMQMVRTFVFGFTQGNGNLTEIGIFDSSTTGIMWTRQLLKDGTGTPTTITKTSSDQLRVTYTLQVIPPQADNTGTTVISGNSFDWTTRPANVSSSNWYQQIFSTNPSSHLNGSNTEAFDNVIDVRTGSPTGTGGQFPTSHSITYTNGNYYSDTTVGYDATAANFAGGIKSFGFFCSSGRFFQMGFNTAILKTNTKALSLVYRFSWGRYP